MSASDKSKIPVGKFGWLILAAVIAAPTAFFLLVTPNEPDEQPAPPVQKRPLSKLESVGLRDYRDWDGLPEIFAVWADKAHWENGRTRFAYWNPATRSYSYFFEARRTSKGYRFREIPEPHDPAFEWDPDATDDVPLRLLLPKKEDIAALISVPDKGTIRRPEPNKVEIDVPSAKLAPEPPKKP
jgi:hypothetical protein